jgi:hypothetical protein
MRILFIFFAFLLPFLDLPALNFDQAAEEIVDAGMQTLLIVREGIVLPIHSSHPTAPNFHRVSLLQMP